IEESTQLTTREDAVVNRNQKIAQTTHVRSWRPVNANHTRITNSKNAAVDVENCIDRCACDDSFQIPPRRCQIKYCVGRSECSGCDPSVVEY
ncbi:hypothetical protein VZ111_22965, partial [Enterobacter hormaechei]